MRKHKIGRIFYGALLSLARSSLEDAVLWGEKSLYWQKRRLGLHQMRARCHRQWASLLHRCGVTGTILVCTGVLVVAGSPELHGSLKHNGAQPGHSCGIALTKASKCAKAIESPRRPLVRRSPAAILPAPRTILTPVWIPKLFLEACRFEHGPPVLS